MREPQHMRVDHHAFCLAERDAQYHIASLARDPGKRQQLRHGLWNFAAKIADQLLRRA